jgi:hypothetical protein
MPATTKAADKFNYVLLENFPGFFKAGEVMTNLPLLITSLFSFAIWTVGIAAMFMIIIGGFQYIISAGNKSTAESGKKLMTDALLGLVAALFAWLFLYIINPDLIKINLSMIGGGGFGTAVSSENLMQKDGTYPVTNKDLPKGCANYKSSFASAAAGTGLDACEIEALAATETGCNPNNSPINKNGTRDCGIMQINSANFPSGKTCQDFINDPILSMQTAANIYKRNYSGAIGNRVYSGDANSVKFKNSQLIRDKYAAYNGGSGALKKSKDCPSTMKNIYGNEYLAYDCPINNGGYVNTPKATSTFLNYYAKCKGANIYK